MDVARKAHRAFCIYTRVSNEKEKLDDCLDYFLSYQDKALNAGDIANRIAAQDVEGEDVRRMARASLRYGPKAYRKIKEYIHKNKKGV